MSRKVKIEVRGYSYDVSVDGAGSRDGVESDAAAAQGWEAHFAHYREDASGRLVYFWQPMTGSLAGIRADLIWLRDHPRPHFSEGFEVVDIVDVGDLPRKTLIGTLHSVTFLEAMEGLVETLRERDHPAQSNCAAKV